MSENIGRNIWDILSGVNPASFSTTSDETQAPPCDGQSGPGPTQPHTVVTDVPTDTVTEQHKQDEEVIEKTGRGCRSRNRKQYEAIIASERPQRRNRRKSSNQEVEKKPKVELAIPCLNKLKTRLRLDASPELSGSHHDKESEDGFTSEDHSPAPKRGSESRKAAAEQNIFDMVTPFSPSAVESGTAVVDSNESIHVTSVIKVNHGAKTEEQNRTSSPEREATSKITKRSSSVERSASQKLGGNLFTNMSALKVKPVLPDGHITGNKSSTSKGSKYGNDPLTTDIESITDDSISHERGDNVIHLDMPVLEKTTDRLVPCDRISSSSVPLDDVCIGDITAIDPKPTGERDSVPNLEGSFEDPLCLNTTTDSDSLAVEVSGSSLCDSTEAIISPDFPDSDLNDSATSPAVEMCTTDAPTLTIESSGDSVGIEENCEIIDLYDTPVDTPIIVDNYKQDDCVNNCSDSNKDIEDIDSNMTEVYKNMATLASVLEDTPNMDYSNVNSDTHGLSNSTIIVHEVCDSPVEVPHLPSKDQYTCKSKPSSSIRRISYSSAAQNVTDSSVVVTETVPETLDVLSHIGETGTVSDVITLDDEDGNDSNVDSGETLLILEVDEPSPVAIASPFSGSQKSSTCPPNESRTRSPEKMLRLANVIESLKSQGATGPRSEMRDEVLMVEVDMDMPLDLSNKLPDALSGLVSPEAVRNCLEVIDLTEEPLDLTVNRDSPVSSHNVKQSGIHVSFPQAVSPLHNFPNKKWYQMPSLPASWGNHCPSTITEMPTTFNPNVAGVGHTRKVSPVRPHIGGKPVHLPTTSFAQQLTCDGAATYDPPSSQPVITIFPDGKVTKVYNRSSEALKSPNILQEPPPVSRVLNPKFVSILANPVSLPQQHSKANSSTQSQSFCIRGGNISSGERTLKHISQMKQTKPVAAPGTVLNIPVIQRRASLQGRSSSSDSITFMAVSSGTTSLTSTASTRSIPTAEVRPSVVHTEASMATTLPTNTLRASRIHPSKNPQSKRDKRRSTSPAKRLLQYMLESPPMTLSQLACTNPLEVPYVLDVNQLDSPPMPVLSPTLLGPSASSIAAVSPPELSNSMEFHNTTHQRERKKSLCEEQNKRLAEVLKFRSLLQQAENEVPKTGPVMIEPYHSVHDSTSQIKPYNLTKTLDGSSQWCNGLATTNSSDHKRLETSRTEQRHAPNKKQATFVQSKPVKPRTKPGQLRSALELIIDDTVSSRHTESHKQNKPKSYRNKVRELSEHEPAIVNSVGSTNAGYHEQCRYEILSPMKPTIEETSSSGKNQGRQQKKPKSTKNKAKVHEPSSNEKNKEDPMINSYSKTLQHGMLFSSQSVAPGILEHVKYPSAFVPTSELSSEVLDPANSDYFDKMAFQYVSKKPQKWPGIGKTQYYLWNVSSSGKAAPKRGPQTEILVECLPTTLPVRNPDIRASKRKMSLTDNWQEDMKRFKKNVCHIPEILIMHPVHSKKGFLSKGPPKCRKKRGPNKKKRVSYTAEPTIPECDSSAVSDNVECSIPLVDQMKDEEPVSVIDTTTQSTYPITKCKKKIKKNKWKIILPYVSGSEVFAAIKALVVGDELCQLQQAFGCEVPPLPGVEAKEIVPQPQPCDSDINTSATISFSDADTKSFETNDDTSIPINTDILAELCLQSDTLASEALTSDALESKVPVPLSTSSPAHTAITKTNETHSISYSSNEDTNVTLASEALASDALESKVPVPMSTSSPAHTAITKTNETHSTSYSSNEDTSISCTELFSSSVPKKRRKTLSRQGSALMNIPDPNTPNEFRSMFSSRKILFKTPEQELLPAEVVSDKSISDSPVTSFESPLSKSPLRTSKAPVKRLRSPMETSSPPRKHSPMDKKFKRDSSPKRSVSSEARKRKKRSLLDELKCSDDFLPGQDSSHTRSLYDDTTVLSREEKALQRAIIQFSQMEEKKVMQEERKRSPKMKSPATLKANALKKKAMKSPAKTETRHPHGRFVDFRPRVLGQRTRLQAAGPDCNKRSAGYHKDDLYDRALSRDQLRLERIRQRRNNRLRAQGKLVEQVPPSGEDAGAASGEFSQFEEGVSGEDAGQSKGFQFRWKTKYFKGRNMEKAPKRSLTRQRKGKNGVGFKTKVAVDLENRLDESKYGSLTCVTNLQEMARLCEQKATVQLTPPRPPPPRAPTAPLQSHPTPSSASLPPPPPPPPSAQPPPLAPPPAQTPKLPPTLPSPPSRTHSVSRLPSIQTHPSRPSSTLPPPSQASPGQRGWVPPEVKALSVCRNTGETILHKAARQGYDDIVSWCARTQYADVDGRDNAGYTPLHEASIHGNMSTARILIAHGATVNVASRLDGVRPLHDAIENDHIEIVRLLLAAGADPTLSTYSGRTALALARSSRMRNLLGAHMYDVTGRGEPGADRPWDVPPWPGHGGYPDDSDEGCGCDVLADCPCDADTLAAHFTLSDAPLLEAYRMDMQDGRGPRNYHFLSAVLQCLGLTKAELSTCIAVGILTLNVAEFRQRSGRPLQAFTDFVELVEMSSHLNALMGVEEVDIGFGQVENDENDENLETELNLVSKSLDEPANEPVNEPVELPSPPKRKGRPKGSRDKAPRKNSKIALGKLLDKSSEKTPSKSTSTSTNNSPKKSPKDSQKNLPKDSPKKSTKDSQKKSPNDSPKKSPNKLPRKSPNDKPKKSPNKSPKKSPKRTPRSKETDSVESIKSRNKASSNATHSADLSARLERISRILDDDVSSVSTKSKVKHTTTDVISRKSTISRDNHGGTTQGNSAIYPSPIFGGSLSPRVVTHPHSPASHPHSPASHPQSPASHPYSYPRPADTPNRTRCSSMEDLHDSYSEAAHPDDESMFSQDDEEAGYGLKIADVCSLSADTSMTKLKASLPTS